MKYLLCLLLVLLTGCAQFHQWEIDSQTPPSTGPHRLVDDWYQETGPSAMGWYDTTIHMCKYDNSVVVNVGFHYCPKGI